METVCNSDKIVQVIGLWDILFTRFWCGRGLAKNELCGDLYGKPINRSFWTD